MSETLDWYHDEVHLHPAAHPQSRSARVYRVEAEDMPGAPKLSHSVQEMMAAAKRRHSKAIGVDQDELTARKIGESSSDTGGYIEVVVVEQNS